MTEREKEQALYKAAEYVALLRKMKERIINLEYTYNNRHKLIFPQSALKDPIKAENFKRAIPRLQNAINNLLDKCKYE